MTMFLPGVGVKFGVGSFGSVPDGGVGIAGEVIVFKQIAYYCGGPTI